MAANVSEAQRQAAVSVDLRNPMLAAVWAWLWPGAGHIYQRRYAKGVLYMVCILSTYFFGLALGNGHVVYASFRKPDFRYAYFCQVGVGIPALPALVQHHRMHSGKQLWFQSSDPQERPIFSPPDVAVREQEYDTLAKWHEDLHNYFEMGTLYTMIAGLLNVLAIFDAYAGPVCPAPQEKKRRPPPKNGDESNEEAAGATAGAEH
jgi:hypothetical protein